MILRDDILVVNNNDFLNIEIICDSKVVIDYYNKKINILVFIRLLMENI